MLLRAFCNGLEHFLSVSVLLEVGAAHKRRTQPALSESQLAAYGCDVLPILLLLSSHTLHTLLLLSLPHFSWPMRQVVEFGKLFGFHFVSFFHEKGRRSSTQQPCMHLSTPAVMLSLEKTRGSGNPLACVLSSYYLPSLPWSRFFLWSVLWQAKKCCGLMSPSWCGFVRPTVDPRLPTVGRRGRSCGEAAASNELAHFGHSLPSAIPS